MHDPAVVRRDDGTFFRFVTHDKIKIATAPSIRGPWTEKGPALPNGSTIQLPGNDDLWAPDVFYYKPTYYMFYSVSQPGSQRSDIGVATSPTMEQGSWTDYGSLGIPDSAEYNKIDANILQPSPTPASAPPSFLLSFGSYWHDVFQVQLANPPLTIATVTPSPSAPQGANKAAADGPQPTVHATPVNLEYNGTSNRPNKMPQGPSEGSYQFWWGVGGKVYYYLFFSSGACCDMDPANLPPAGEEYKIMVCRSEKPNEGFVDKDGKKCTESGGTMVLGSSGNMYAPGGQGALFDKDLNSPILYYHYSKWTIFAGV